MKTFLSGKAPNMSQKIRRFFFLNVILLNRKRKEVNSVLAVAFLIAIVIAFLYGFNFLGKLLLFIGAIVFYVLNLSILFDSSVSTVLIILTLGIGLMLFWIYVRVAEEREQKERNKQINGQSNLT